MSEFQQMMDSVAAIDDNTFSATVLPTWLQGRTAFGGLSSALVVAAMLQRVPEDRRLRSIAVSFVGPIPAGDHRIELTVLRSGGSVTHMRGELLCESEVALSVLATFGKERPLSVSVDAPALPDVVGPEPLDRWPYIDGVTPRFTQQFDMRLAYGGVPMSGSPDADFGIWTRFRQPLPVSPLTLIAIADAPPLPGLNMLPGPGLASSLTWYLEFPTAIKPWADDSWWYTDYRSQSGGDGYFHNFATIWHEDGTAVMYARQVATVFEK